MFGFFAKYNIPSISEIDNKICIGNEATSKNKKLLKDYGITHILVCGNGLQKHFEGEFQYLHLPLDDVQYQDLFPYISKQPLNLLQGHIKC